MKNTIIYILFLFSIFINAQNNFEKIDSLAKEEKYRGDIIELVNNLTNTYDSDIDKTRAIYSWIIENISYDIKKYYKRNKKIKIKCKNKLDCQLKKQEIENKLIRDVLKSKKGICSGYSKLFKRMCDIANVKCLEIDGYVKTKPNHVAKKGILDHSWNVIMIDNKPFYLDLTWAAGYCTKNNKGRLEQFIKQQNDFYWLTPVEKFSIDHFPKNPEKIIGFKISIDDYINQPYIENSIIPNIEIVQPREGILRKKIGDTIRFKVLFEKKINNIQINTNIKRNPKVYSKNKKGEMVFNKKAFDKQEFINFTKNKNEYEFIYVIENNKLKFIEILFDYNLKIKYVVKIINE